VVNYIEVASAFLRFYIREANMRKWLLLLLISILTLIIFGCDQPANEIIKDDFQRAHPKAQIVLIKPVEKSSDTYRVNISYRPDTSYAVETAGSFQEDIFLYKKINGKWINTWRRSSGKKEQPIGNIK
jgi:hypothetical protein